MPMHQTWLVVKLTTNAHPPKACPHLLEDTRSTPSQEWPRRKGYPGLDGSVCMPVMSMA